jgi:membrane protein required for colicin V production
MELSELKNLDYFMAIIVLASSYFACKKGFIESFLDFTAWVGSAIIVLDAYDFTYNLLNEYIPSKFICAFISSVGLYIALVIGISFLCLKFLKLVSSFVGGNTDKFLGVIFGAVRGFLIASLIFWSLYMALFAINDKSFPDWFTKAKSYKILKMSSDAIVEALTSKDQRLNMLKTIERKSNSLEKEMKDTASEKASEVKKVTTSSDYFDN